VDDKDPRMAVRIHAVVDNLPRLDQTFARSDIPRDGIYLLFEDGETTLVGGQQVDRIVRVGTHRVDGRLSTRLRHHFSGNRRSSVYRLHLGGALLAREDSADPRLTPWLDRHGTRMPDVEEWVSHVLRVNFRFVCFPVATPVERLSLERGLIAALAQQPLGSPSDQWLGRHARHPTIRRSGLWNTQGVDALPLTDVELERVTELIAG